MARSTARVARPRPRHAGYNPKARLVSSPARCSAASLGRIGRIVTVPSVNSATRSQSTITVWTTMPHEARSAARRPVADGQTTARTFPLSSVEQVLLDRGGAAGCSTAVVGGHAHPVEVCADRGAGGDLTDCSSKGVDGQGLGVEPRPEPKLLDAVGVHDLLGHLGE